MSSSARRFTKVVLGLLAAAGLVVASPTAASAHDTLLSSSPAAGSTLATAPRAITLTFNGEVLTALKTAVVDVVDPEKHSLTDGEPLIDGTVLTQPLSTHAEAGTVTVRWRVVSSDAHPIDGDFRYTVARSARVAAPSPSTSDATPASSAAAPAEASVPAPPDSAGRSPAPLYIAGGIVVVGIGLVLGLLLVVRHRARTGAGGRADR